MNQDSDECFVIAEAGINHNGDFSLAKRMVEEAASAGADAVKFQTFDTDELVTENTEKAEYQIRDDSLSQYEMLKHTEFTREQFVELVDYCETQDIEFMSTPYDPASAKLLADLGVDRLKIASADLVNKPLIDTAADTDKQLILSTGMATLGEIERAMDWVEAAGVDNVVLLHCVSCYPTEPEQVNLRFMDTLSTVFDCSVGFSDHTLGTEVPAGAAARGATVVEKHFTLDRGMDGPDHFASLEPEELSEMVDAIRNIEVALGSSKRELTDAETSNIYHMRRSLHVRRALAAGETIERDDIKIIRPAEGISPGEIETVVGRTVRSDLGENDPVTWVDIE